MQEKNINLQESCLNKRLYISYEDAVKARNRRSKKAKISLRIYKCPICKGYHLTSKVYVRGRNINENS